MQKNSSKFKKNKEAIKDITVVWEEVYGKTYDEGLNFLIDELKAKDINLKKTISDIKAKKPVQYILGVWPFYQGNYLLSEDVLIPRPETEILVDFLANNFNAFNKILDLGTGSGCIAIELSKIFVESEVTGVDLSKKALEIAEKNNLQTNNKVKFIQSNWFSKVDEKFDLIVSNPPYVSKGLKLDESLIHEPDLALYSTDRGLSDFKIIINNLGNFLKKDGKILFEHGVGQDDELKKMLQNKNFTKISSIKDFKNINRFIFAQKK